MKIPVTEAALRRAGAKPKLYHRADKIRTDGAVSALCFKSPRSINLAISQWTIRDEAVTCPRCLKAIAARKKED